MKPQKILDPWLFTSDEDAEKAYMLNTAKDLDPLLERIGDARYVLLGEASHGTHEYYTWRSAISRRLIEEKGFRFIAVEGDWPDCYRINRHVKGFSPMENTAELLRNFNRWPTWMWANWETAALVTWLKEHNTRMPSEKKTGFYGLDVYSLWESMDALITYLKKADPASAQVAREAMKCFERHGRSEQLYAEQVHSVPAHCRDEALNLLLEVRKKSTHYDEDPEAALNTEQNAHIAVQAEKYYRSMMSFNDESWNIRDRHMAETLERLMEFHGPDAKAIIWEHNTHIGDARFTDMKKARMVNVGQVVRETHGEKDTVLVGFGSYCGSVIAGRAWNSPMEHMTVPPAREGSLEQILHNESTADRMLIFDRKNKKERFNKRTVFHRAIGVVYNPELEYHNYVPSRLNGRYDAFLFLDKTKALHAMHFRPDGHQVPETYPFEF